MPSWGRRRRIHLGQLPARMAAEGDEMVHLDKDDPDVLREPSDCDSEFRLLASPHGIPDICNSAIYRVRQFLDRLNRSEPPTPEGSRSPVPPDRRTLLLRQCLQRSRHRSGRSAQSGRPASARHADSPWPSPARGRRQPPPLRDVHSTPEVSSGLEALSASSSLTSVSTISSSYVGDELVVDDWESEEEHYPDQDWLACDRAPIQLTVDTRCSSEASSVRSGGIHFTARPTTRESSVSSGIVFSAKSPMTEPGEPAPNNQSEDYGKMLTLEDLKSYNSNCLSCGVSWRNEEASLDCNECGGYPLQRPCPQCSGKCGSVWRRDLTKSHDKALAAWVGTCALEQPDICRQIQELKSNS